MAMERVRARTPGLVAVLLTLLAAQPLEAAAVSPLHILVPNILEGAIRELQPMLSSRLQAQLDIEYVQMSLIADRLDKGEAADVAILTKANIRPLQDKGRIRAQYDLVQSALGIALPDGKPLPPMKTTDDLIAFIKATPSIALFGTGASAAVLTQFAEKNGMAETLQSKAVVITEGYAGALVRDGKVASAMQQIAELKFGGANNIVPLPEALQTRPVSAVIVLESSQQPAVAARLAALLRSPEAVAAYRKAGLTPVNRADVP